MSKPFISVITTAYNYEQYLDEAIASVLASTYKNFEYIIMDDCSTDRTNEIATRYSKQDARIKLYRNDKNLGDYSNRNKGASFATGKYIKYVDADDRILPNCLQEMLNLMEHNPEAALLLCINASNILNEPKLLNSQQSFEMHFLKGFNLFGIGPSNTLICAEKFREYGGFSPGVRFFGDVELWQKMALKHHIIVMSNRLTSIRHHVNNEGAIERNDMFIQYLRMTMTFQLFRDEQFPLDANQTNKLILNIRLFRIRLIFSALKRFQFRNAYRIVDHLIQ